MPQGGHAGCTDMAQAHYDELETQEPDGRERAQCARLSGLLARAKTAPGWARRLDAIDPKSVASRAALAALPLLRKSELPALQQADPPFGGFNVTPPGRAQRLMMSPGPLFEPEAETHDGYGTARALFACGFRPGDIVHNSFSYHLTPGAFILESGLQALGCATIAGGVGNTEQQVDAIAHFKPSGYAGTPDFLKILLDAAEKSGKDASSFARALVSGAALPASLRRELGARGIDVLQCYAIAEAGVIAYETAARDGMGVNEHLVVEIVRPGTGDPVPVGDVGEVVVTSFNRDYPMIRLATGDLSAVLPGRSPCGRPNMRIRGWVGRADQTTKVKGMFVHPSQIAAIVARHPGIAKARLVVDNPKGTDTMTLHVEVSDGDSSPREAIVASIREVTKLRGEVTIRAPGELANDGKVIDDVRRYV